RSLRISLSPFLWQPRLGRHRSWLVSHRGSTGPQHHPLLLARRPVLHRQRPQQQARPLSARHRAAELRPPLRSCPARRSDARQGPFGGPLLGRRGGFLRLCDRSPPGRAFRRPASGRDPRLARAACGNGFLARYGPCAELARAPPPAQDEARVAAGHRPQSPPLPTHRRRHRCDPPGAAPASPGPRLKQSYALYRRLLAQTRPYSRGFVFAILGMIVAAATEPLFPALMKPLLDDGFVNQSGLPLWVVPTALITIFVVRGIATFTSSYAMAWVANKVLVDLRRKMFDHMLRLPASEFEREASGLLISKLVFEVTNVTGAATWVLTVVVRDSLVVVGLLGWLVYLNWRLTLVAIVLIPVTGLIIGFYSKRMRVLSRRNLEQTGELTRVVEEAVHGFKVIKIFDAYAHESRVFERTAERLRGFAMRMTVAGSATVPITQLAASVAVAVVVTIALVQAGTGQTTVGGFVSFITAMLMLLAPLKHLADVNHELQRGLAAAEAVFSLLDRQPEADAGTRSIERATGALRFENVGFTYAGSES